MFFFEIRKTEPFPGSPFSDHFWRLFFEKFYIALFLGKILVTNYRIVCEVNFAPKAQKNSTDIRKSAVLDAVLDTGVHSERYRTFGRHRRRGAGI